MSVNDVIVKACAVALEKFPMVNASFQNNQLVYPDGIHIGIAIAVDEGLLVGVVRHCEQKSLRRIAQEAQTLVQKARDGKLMPDEMTGNTFTVSESRHVRGLTSSARLSTRLRVRFWRWAR